MKTFVLLVTFFGLSLCEVQASLKTEMERICRDDSEYANADMIEDWEGAAVAYELVGSDNCSKQRLRIIRDNNSTLTYIILSSHVVFEEFNFKRIGNHYESSDDTGMPRSTQYFFPVLDSDGEPISDLLLIMDCANYPGRPGWRVLSREYEVACDYECRENLNATGFEDDLEMCSTY